MSWRQLACAVAASIAVMTSGICYADDDRRDAPDHSKDMIDRSVVQQGFDASPIPKNQLNFAGKDPFLVGLGAYLVNAAADCSGCHSSRDFSQRAIPPAATRRSTIPTWARHRTRVSRAS